MKLSYALAAALLLGAAPVQAETVRFMTGPQGGVWVPLGGQLKDIWEKAVPGLTVQALPGAGMANIRGVQEEKTEIGFGNSISTVDAIAGNAPFKKPHDKVCNIATLYPQYFQILVPADSGIKSVKEFDGKSLTTQPRGNTGEMIAQQILKANGLSSSDVKISHVSYTDSVEQMKNGHAEVFALGTTIPSGAVMDLAASMDVKLLDLSSNLEAMKKLNPGYTLVTVPANTYPKQAADVQVIGYATHVVASCAMSEDMVYTMTKTIAENIPSLAATSKSIKGLTAKGMAEEIGVPFHPGAAKFYREQGVEVSNVKSAS